MNKSLIGILALFLLVIPMAHAVLPTGYSNIFTFDDADNPNRPGTLTGQVGFINFTGSVSTSGVQGAHNQAYSFSNEYLNKTSTSVLNVTGASDISITMWINFTDTTAYMNLFEISNSVPAIFLAANYGATGKIGFDVQGGLINPANTYNDGKWHNIVAIIRANKTAELYIEGVPKGSAQLGTYSLTNAYFYLGHQEGQAGRNLRGEMDEVYIYPRALNLTDILFVNSSFYQSSAASNYSVSLVNPTPADNTARYFTSPYFEVNVSLLPNVTEYISDSIQINIYNSTGLYALVVPSTTSCVGPTLCFHFVAGSYYANLTSMPIEQYKLEPFARLNNLTYLYGSNRTITIYEILNGTFSSNSTISSQYKNVTWVAASTTKGAVAIAYYELRRFNGTTITLIYNGTKPYYYWNTYVENMSIGTSTSLLLTSVDALGNSLQTDSLTLNVTSNALLNITAFDYLGVKISNFSILFGNTNYVTKDGNISINIVRSLNYSLFLNASGYGLQNVTYAANDSAFQFYNFTGLYPANSINITFYDGVTLAKITSAIQVTDYSGSFFANYSATGGNILFSGVPTGYNYLTFSSPSYDTSQIYTYLVYSGYNVLNAYLFNGTSTTTLNFKDSSGAILSNVQASISRIVNNTWVIVDAKTSDINGNVIFNYLPNTVYRFDASLSRYTNYSQVVNPIISANYYIVLDSSGSASSSNNVFVVYYPGSFYYNQSNNFSISFSSPFNALANYNFSLQGRNFYISDAGSSSSGSPFSIAFNLNNAVSGDNVTLDYYYLLINGSSYSFKQVFNVVVPTQPRTIASMGNQYFGLLLGDRIFLVTIFNLILLGIGFLSLGLLGGITLAFINTIIFASSGFVPWATFYATLIIGIIIILSRGIE